MQISRTSPLTLLLALAAAVGLLLPVSTAGAGDPLWEKGVILAERMESDGVIFGTMKMHSLVKKKDGSVETDIKVTYKTVKEGDNIGVEVVSATENGKDITAKMREEEKGHKKKKEKKDDEKEVGISINPGDHPFDPELQKDITYQRVGSADLDGRETILFRYTHRMNDKKGTKGRAWLDPETGAPIAVVAQPDPLPKMVDEMTSRTTFKVTEEGYWVPETGEMNGSGGFLWIKRWMEMRMTFSDYCLKETLKSAGDPES